MPDRNEGQPKKRDDIVDGEIIAELPDETLMSLPPVESEPSEHLGIPKIHDEPTDSSRRQLLVRLAIGGAAALALGGSAALLITNNSGGQRVVVLPNGAQVNGGGTLDVAELIKQIDDLQTELASTKTERDGFATQLQTATTDLSNARSALQAAEALNTLWQQLDEIGLDDLLIPALQAAATAYNAVQTVSTALGNGITEVQNSLDQFIKLLPGPKAGLQWLQAQVTALASSLSNLATQVQQAVEPVQPYAQMIANFVSWVLDRLPFGVGDKAKSGLNAMNSIVGGLPAIVDGINQQVMNPLIVWFGDDQVRNFYGLLLDPVANKLLEPARGIQSQLSNFTESFQNKLVTPAQTALDQRTALRTQIDDLRALPTKSSSHITGTT